MGSAQPRKARIKGVGLYDLEGVLGSEVIDFVERHVDSLLAWDIVVFYQRNQDAALDADGLASRLGRSRSETLTAAQALCASGFLISEDGRFVCLADETTRSQAKAFAESCSDRGRRLALIALVLHRIGRS